MDYKWIVQGKANDYKEAMRYILQQKNISQSEIRNFVDINMVQHAPYLLSNMDCAIDTIKRFLDKKICIIGDYDVDGITATAILYIGLRNLSADVCWILPHKLNDGYGMSKNMINNAHSQGVELIITVDNGVNAVDEIEYAKQLGMEVVVTDHHQPKSILPDAIIVNPHLSDNYPFHNICGCMVAFKLVMAINSNIQSNESIYNQLLSLAAIGTIADVMPLIDENRYYVKYGLDALKHNDNVGIQSLLKQLKIASDTITSTDIGFYVAPCLNASGRMDTADLSLKLLLTEDVNEANSLAKKIIDLNNQRKEIQNNICSNMEFDNDDSAIVIELQEQAGGILGIIAGKISSTYQKPCFVLGMPNSDGYMTGSGRSIYGYNLCELIEYVKDIVDGGGHPEAAGISLNKNDLAAFKEKFSNHFNEWKNKNGDIVPELNITCEYYAKNSKEIDRLYANIKKLEPFGYGNEDPMFIMKDVKVNNFKVLGKQKNVLKMSLNKDDLYIDSVGFNNIIDKYNALEQPSCIDVVYNLNYNSWSNSIQLIVKDITCKK